MGGRAPQLYRGTKNTPIPGTHPNVKLIQKVFFTDQMDEAKLYHQVEISLDAHEAPVFLRVEYGE